MRKRPGSWMEPAAAVATVLVSSGIALACSCSPPPPPCEAIGYSELVFTGTILAVTAERPFKTARMKVDRVYKGRLEPEVDLFDDGMCDGPDLQAGRKYLMYTRRLPSGSIPSRGCTRSRGIEYAAEDLEFLDRYAAGNTTTAITGTVRFFLNERTASSREEPAPMKDVLVTLSGQGFKDAATTDASGRYAFSGMPPGKYRIIAELAGHRMAWTDGSLKVPANGCAVADVTMQVDRRVHGVVRDELGEPLTGALVEMVQTKPSPKRWERPILLGVSDRQGRYAIDGIPPGEYYLGLNIQHTPTKEHPYSPVYYPNTKDVTQAIAISMMTGASSLAYDLTGTNLPVVTLRGRIVDGAGAPVKDRPNIRLKEPGLDGQIDKGEVKIDADGRFEYPLCQGVRYSAFAFSGSISNQLYSAPVEFVAAADSPVLVLVVNKSFQEFQALTRKLQTK